jgi:hypothetical protein
VSTLESSVYIAEQFEGKCKSTELNNSELNGEGFVIDFTNSEKILADKTSKISDVELVVPSEVRVNEMGSYFDQQVIIPSSIRERKSEEMSQCEQSTLFFRLQTHVTNVLLFFGAIVLVSVLIVVIVRIVDSGQ